MKRLHVLAPPGTALFGLATAPARADTYPSRVVTVVVPYPAGGIRRRRRAPSRAKADGVVRAVNLVHWTAPLK